MKNTGVSWSKIFILVVIVIGFNACKDRPDKSNIPERDREPEMEEGHMPRHGGERGHPTGEEILEIMDLNKDGKLSIEEVEGPLKDDFSEVDTNSDGFLTKVEIEEAPKPGPRQ